MSLALRAFAADELGTSVRPEIAEAARIVGERLDAVAVLFYGSVLRTGDLDGLLDFYVLTDRTAPRGLRGLASRLLWPDISFEEIRIGERRLRAKVATMPLATFRRAAAGEFIDTTIWTRFVQPSALLWSKGRAAQAVIGAVASAAVTAARFAAMLGPAAGAPRSYWKTLFRETYETELRVEKPGREEQILDFDPRRYDALLRLAWEAGEVDYHDRGSELRPVISQRTCRELAQAWLIRQHWGRALNMARLVKAAFLLEGAARYAAWKIQRHTGVAIKLTPWREHHPLLAAPGMLWQIWRAR